MYGFTIYVLAPSDAVDWLYGAGWCRVCSVDPALGFIFFQVPLYNTIRVVIQALYDLRQAL